MRRVTVFLVAGMFVLTANVFAQATDFAWEVELSADPTAPYALDHSGARTVWGPVDLDADGKPEVLVSDYSQGGRVHVLENIGPDSWELVYSSPNLDEYDGTGNARAIGAGDLDQDGRGEFFFLSGCASRSPCDTPFANPAYPQGLYVFENTGVDNDYGTAPASIYQIPVMPDRNYVEQFDVTDVDGDGFDEILFGNNGRSSDLDNWYIVGVDGDIGSGFETWITEALWTSRERAPDMVDRGGGSPYGMVAADLDGNGTNEIVMTSWNNLNVTLARALGFPNTYLAPGAGAQNRWAHLHANDRVSLFGVIAVDIDGDGNEEVYGTTYSSGGIYVVNYNPGENVQQITEANYASPVVDNSWTLGMTIGDLDGDGNMDLIGTGKTYSASQFNDGLAPNWIDIVEFTGGDPEDPANYSDPYSVFFPEDQLDSFDLVVRDSAGVITEYRESGAQGGEFVSKLAFLGDVDNDGWNEVAMGFQGVDDSTFVFNETFNPADSTYSRVLVSATANPRRTFMRVLASNGSSIAIQEDRVVVPSDYVLEQNYPNPFNPSTTIRFTLPIDKSVSVRIYDVSGRVVRTVVDNQFFNQGMHEVTWDGTNQGGSRVASGTYLYTLEYGNFRQTKSMVLLK